MIFPSVKRSDPDKGFTSVRNQHSAALVDGDVVAWNVSGEGQAGYTRIAGVDVKLGTLIVATVAGVVSNPQGNSCAVGDFCLCQTYGLHPNVKTSVAALAVDVVVTAGAAGVAVVRAIALVGDIDDQELGVCITTGAGSRAGIFIKCM